MDRLKPATTEFFVWDASLAGFGVRVQPTGVMSYVVKYRAGSGRGAPTRRMTLARIGTLTPDEARVLARKTLGSVAHGADPATQRAADRQAATITETVRVFLADHAKAKRAERTADSYRDILERLVLPELGTRKADKVTTADIHRLHRKLRNRPAQANKTVRVLSSLFTFAAKTRLVPEGFNPCRGIEKYPEQGRERYLSIKELNAIGEAIRIAETDGIAYAVDAKKPTAKHAPKEQNRRTVIGPHAAAAIRLLIFTGARLREILNLEWTHVDLERGLLLLPTSKTGKKTVILNAPAMGVLSAVPRIGKYVIAGNSAGTKNERPRADLKKPWRAISKHAGLTAVRIHDLRHTHASVGAGSGLSLPIIGKLLGHSQSATTQRYAHLNDDPLRKASDQIGQHLAEAMGEVTTRTSAISDIRTARKLRNRRN